jgi:uncharacterized protein YbjT (DUF2867 family)
MRIFVTGATGYVGSRLVSALLGHGHDVVVAARDPAKLGRYGWIEDVTPVLLDVADPDSVDSALAVAGPVDVLYYLVHGIGQPGFRAADNLAAAAVAGAARRAGVARIVYLGGFVPGGGALSEHLAGRAEVADALAVDGGAEVVWLGAAMIIGAGSTSFEMLRYVGDRFPLLPKPGWMDNPIDPISIRDVLHYLVAAADAGVPAGGYDITGPESATYGGLLSAYARVTHARRAGLRVPGVDLAVLTRLSGFLLPLPAGLATDLVASLEFPMSASENQLRDVVSGPPGGLTGIGKAIARSLWVGRPRPVDRLADPHHLADTDAEWAGGDVLRIRRLATAVLPSVVHPALRLLSAVPKPVAGVVRSGLDLATALVPRVVPT